MDWHNEPGNMMQRLQPMATMDTPFSLVLYYRTYQLDHNRSTLTAAEEMEVYKFKSRIDELHSKLGTFTGTPAMKMLSFFPTLRDALNFTGASEATAMRFISYYLDGEALDVHEKQLITVTDDPEEKLYGESTLCERPHILNALTKRIMKDDVFQDAYITVPRATKREGEAEATISMIMYSSSRKGRCSAKRTSSTITYVV